MECKYIDPFTKFKFFTYELSEGRIRPEFQKTSNLQTRFGDIFSGIGDIFGPKDG